MKKFLLCMLMVFVMTTAACAAPKAKIFTMTIKSSDIKTVQEAIYQAFTDQKFSPVGMFPDRVVMQKGFGDGFITARVVRTSTFITEQMNNNVVVTATQKELRNGIFEQEVSIEPLLGFLKPVKTKLDGTSLETIVDETQEIADRKNGKQIGFTISGKDNNGNYLIQVDEYGVAAKKGFATGDAIVEINGSPVKGMSQDDVEKLLSQKWKDKVSIFLLIIHNGKQDMKTIKNEQ